MPPFVKGAAQSAGGFWRAAIGKQTFVSSISTMEVTMDAPIEIVEFSDYL
jgi:hypothetical protein